MKELRSIMRGRERRHAIAAALRADEGVLHDERSRSRSSSPSWPTGPEHSRDGPITRMRVD